MPELTGRDVHVDSLLTNILVGYKNDSYIADQIFPIVPVMKQSNIVPKFTQSAWFRNEARLRAPGSKSQRSGFSTDNTDTYYCARFSHGYEIPDDVRDNADSPYNLDQQGAEFAQDKIMLVREVNFAADFFKTSVWATDKTGGSDFTVFSDYAGSTPLPVITGYVDTVEGLIGREPNTAVMGKQVWSQLKWHPDLIDTIKYTQRAQMTVELAAALLGFDRLLVGKGIYTASPEGTAESSVSYTRIWGKNILMLYVPETPSIMAPAAGYTFVWQKVANALQFVKRMRDEEREIDIIEANSYFDQKAIATKAGLFMSGAVA